MTAKSVALILCSCAALLGCTSTALNGGDDGGPKLDLAPRVPVYHRAAAIACPSSRPAYDCMVQNGAPSTCAKDIDCTKGMNGRCVGSGRNGCNCSYDTCVTDKDCGAGQLCDCRDRWYLGANGPNTCMPGNCIVDADCGPHGFCSPSLDPGCGAFIGVTGWYCHTAQDTCLDDGDCVGRVDGGFGPPFCGYRPELHYWACSATQCVG